MSPIEQAFEHHRAGRLREAQAICQQVLTSEPNNPDALHLLGLIALQVGQHTAAVELIGRAAELDRSSPGHHASLGQALATVGRLDDAVAAYRRAIDLHAGFPEAHVNLAGVLARQGKFDDAIEQCRSAIKLRADWWLAHYNLGLIFAAAKKMEDAAAELDRASSLEPNNPQIWNDLGSALRATQKWDESIAAYRRAIAIRPDFAAAHANLANVMKESGRARESITSNQQAVALKPDFVEPQINLGMTLRDQGRIDEALEAFQKALEHRPDSPEAHNGLASVLHDLGRYDQAIEHYQQALQLRPDWPLAMYNLAFEHLLKGDFARGWPALEARWNATELSQSRLKLDGPRWNGEELNGRTILLHAEQGFGDAIQFVRYVPLVKQRGGKVALVCHPELVQLFQSVDGAKQVLSLSGPLPRFDVQCSLLSLPGIFGTNLQNIPSHVPYLSADFQLASRWNDQLLAQPAKMRVGVCWAGRKHIRGRSIEPSLLAPLNASDEISLVSLQKGGAPGAIPKLLDLTDAIRNFADTAAIIQNLDLVVTIDTAVAHLAGAMAKPVWVLLPSVPDWRWMLDREDSPWYPTMRLFRQQMPGDWSQPMKRIVEALKEMRI